MSTLSSLSFGPYGLRASLILCEPPPPTWRAVRTRFEQFDQNTKLTSTQRDNGLKNYNCVVSCLNRNYYGTPSATENAFLIGSWGRDTAVRPPRDVDMYFVLPFNVYTRFHSYAHNRQSALLQEVKTVLGRTYARTEMRGDGQVVIVRFDSFSVEVVPAFLLTNGRYWICDTRSGGSYKETDPFAELNRVEQADQNTNGNLRSLIRMLKAWQDTCSVPIKSFQLELLAADFLSQSSYRLKDFFWFDWIIRDFFAYLYHKTNALLAIPGTSEIIPIGNAWQSRAEAAYRRAEKACYHEQLNMVVTAGDEWQKIFGQQIPRNI